MKATLVFPKKGTAVLLAKKVRKIGAGKWNGFGGKPEPKDLSIRHTACRELFQESGKGMVATPEDLQPKALINFFLFQNTSNEPDWSVAIYLVENFSGEIKDSDEMVGATWFPIDSIPYDDMLPADRDFVPKIFEGDTFKGKVRFNEDLTAVIESEYTNTKIDI